MSTHRTTTRRSRPRGTVLATAAVLATGAGLLGPPSAGAAQAPAEAAASAASTASGARVVSETRIDSRTFDLWIDSPAVGATVPVRVMLPAGWADEPGRTWPVLYLLQGAHDDYTSWTRETDIEEFTEDKDLITVMPSAGPTGIPTRWRDGGGPDYETFQIDELMEVLRRDYRAGATRAVAGVSTGGYGAMAFAARRPGVFTAAASYSGILHTTFPGVPTVVQAIVAREGLGRRSLWGDPFLNAGTWREHNPYDQAAGLRGTALYVSQGSGVVGGSGDPLGEALESTLWPAATAFMARLELLRIPATVNLYRGGSHSWPYWNREFDASWPLLAKALGLPTAASR